MILGIPWVRHESGLHVIIYSRLFRCGIRSIACSFADHETQSANLQINCVIALSLMYLLKGPKSGLFAHCNLVRDIDC